MGPLGGAKRHAEHGWLAAVLPANARRFRVAESTIAAGIADAGGELVSESPDVEIAPLERLRGDAPVAIVSLGHFGREARGVLERAGRRALRSFAVRARAARASRALRRLGYSQTTVIAWDVAQPFPLPGRPLARRRPLVEYLPQRALVIATRAPTRTLLDSAIAAAGGEIDARLRTGSPSMSEGSFVIPANGFILRVAVGPARVGIQRQAEALDQLRARGLPPGIAERVPAVLSSGAEGLVVWSLEDRLPGAPPPPELSEPFIGDCVDFLAALHAGRGAPDARTAPGDNAEVIARVCGTEEARATRALASRVEAELAGVRRGFAHGDFFAGNLLARGDRLAGVIDWDAAGGDRLPLLDLLHFQFNAEHQPAASEWGPTLVRELLPWARAGGDEVTRDYCRRIALDADPDRLVAFVVAYWLDYLAFQLDNYEDRTERPRWMANNVHAALRALAVELGV